MNNWLCAGNVNKVHAILMKHIVPSYFNISGFTEEPSSLMVKYSQFLIEFIKDKIEKQA